MKSKVLTVFFYISLALNIITAAGILLCYRYRYPVLYMKDFTISDVYILLLPILATILIFAGGKVLKKIRATRILYGTAYAMAALAVLFSVLCSILMFIIPPLCSRTENAAEYRKADGVFAEMENFIDELYPEQIPDNASQVTYYYERYSAFLSDTMEMKASWILPKAEYNTVKYEMLHSPLFKNGTVTAKDGVGMLFNDLFPGGVSLFFEYDDGVGRVTYRTYIEKKY